MSVAESGGLLGSPVAAEHLKELEEVHTHPSESCCSSSESLDGSAKTSTEWINQTLLDVRMSTPVSHSAAASTGLLREPRPSQGVVTPPTPCGIPQEVLSASRSAFSMLRIDGTTEEAVPLTKIPSPSLSLPSSSVRKVPTPPAPIGFLNTAADKWTATSSSPSAANPSPVRDPNVAVDDAPLASADRARLSAPASASPETRPPLSPCGLDAAADPFYPGRLCDNLSAMGTGPVACSLSFPQPQGCEFLCDSIPTGLLSSPTTSSGHHYRRRYAVHSPIFAQMARSPTADLNTDAASGTSGREHGWQNLQAAGFPTDGVYAQEVPWWDPHSPLSCQRLLPPMSSTPSGYPPGHGWPISAAHEGGAYDGCLIHDGVEGEMPAGVLPSAFASTGSASMACGLDPAMCGGPSHFVDGNRPCSSFRDGLSKRTPAHVSFSTSPSYVADSFPVALPTGAPACTYPPHVYDGDYGHDYIEGACPLYGDAPTYASEDARYPCYVPQAVECVGDAQRLHQICMEILMEAEAHLQQRVRRIQEQSYRVEEDNMDREEEGEGSTVIALDLEGRSLGREGSICIITLATHSTVYIIDIVVLGESALSPGSALRQVLESCQIIKLMFDCRADCDALFFLYGVRLQRVCDLQISSCFALYPRARRLPSMKDVFVKLGLFEEGDMDIKNAGRHLFNPRSGGNFDCWERRPLAEILLHYCAVDVKYFFLAHMMLKDHVEEGCLLGEERLNFVCGGHFLGSSKGNAFRDFQMR